MAKKIKKARKPGSAQKIGKRTPSKDASPVANSAVTDETLITAFPCKHSEKGINFEKLETQLLSEPLVLKCQACLKQKGRGNERKGKAKKNNKKPEQVKLSEADKSYWICLSCGLVSCGGEAKENSVDGHSWQHWLYTRHPYALLCKESLSCWCFPCQSFLKDSRTNENKDGDSLYTQTLKLVRQSLLNPVEAKIKDVDEACSSCPLRIEQKGIHYRGQIRYTVKGLANLGNTCFFNSVMQNLLALNALRSHFSKPSEIPEGPVTSALRKLYAETSIDDFAEGNAEGVKRTCKQGGVINPKGLFGAVCAKATQFRGYQQQDSHELLRYLVDCLQIEEVCSKNSASDFDQMTSGDNNEQTSDTSVQNRILETETLVDCVFNGQLCSTVSCSHCGHCSVVYEPFHDLSLPLPTKSTSTKKVSRPAQKLGASSKSRGRQKAKISSFERKNDKQDAVIEDNSFCAESFSHGSLSTSSETTEQKTTESFDTNQVLVESHGAYGHALKEDSLQNDSIDHAPVKSTVESHVVYGPALKEDSLHAEPSDQAIVEPHVVYGPALKEDSLHNRPMDQGIVEADVVYGPTLEEDSLDVSWLDYVDSNVKVHDGLNESSFDTVENTNQSESCYLESEMCESFTVPDNFEEEPPLPVLGTSEVLLLPYYKEEEEANGEVKSSSIVLDNAYDTKEGKSYFSVDGDSEDTDVFGNLFEGEEASFLEREESEEYVSESFTFEENSNNVIAEVDDTSIPMSVEGCLTRFTMPEVLSGENAWKCEKCASNLRTQTIEKGMVNQEKDTKKQDPTDLAKPMTVLDISNGTPNGRISTSDDERRDNEESSSHSGLLGQKDCQPRKSIKTENLSQNPDWIVDTNNHSIHDDLHNGSEGFEHHEVKEDSNTAVSDISKIPLSSNTVVDGGISTTAGCDLQSQSVKQRRSERIQKRKAKKNKNDVDANDSERQELHIDSVTHEATKRFLISKTPLVLTVHLKRFSQDMKGRLNKLTGHVAFQEILDLRPYLDPRCEDKDHCTYRLMGVVEHSGNMKYGHYVAYVRCHQDKLSRDNRTNNPSGCSSWFHISDSFVRNASLSEVLQSEAYLLFYEKCLN